MKLCILPAAAFETARARWRIAIDMDGHAERPVEKKNGYRSDEDMFRFLVENSGDILWTIDLTGRWQFMTSNVEKAIHIPAKDIIGGYVWDFVAPEYREILKNKLKRRMAGEDIPAYEVTVIDKYGKRVPFEVKTSPILDMHGKIVGIQGISRDITLRKKTEEALRKSEERFRDLVESIYDWVWEADQNLVFTYSSPRVRDNLGYAPEEVIGKSLYEFMEPDEARRVAVLLQDLVRQRERYEIAEKTLISKTGEHVIFEMRVTLTYDDKGNLTGFKGICRDIRERKRAEEALRKAYGELERRVEERTRDLAQARSTLQGILNTAPLGIVVASAPDGNISFYSPGAEKIFGDEVAGNAYRPLVGRYRLLRPDGVPLPHDELPLTVSLREGKRIADVEMQYVKRNGEKVDLLVSSAPILDENGRIRAAVAAIVDITRLKSTENELRDAKAQAELYLDLMSHDINNMNMMAIGYIDMAQPRVAADPESAMLLQKSADMLKSSSELIENVRKLRKAELGELKLEPVDLCGIIESVRRKYSTVPGRSIDISVISRHPQDRTVMASRLLEDVFANLVGNSIKHALPDQPVTIEIILSEICEDGREYYRVAVEDNGPGIADDLKGKLFTRLQRGKTKTAGRGLGLYLVKALVKDFGGKIWVEDRVPGNYREGTRFVVLLPAATPMPEAGTGTCAG